MRHEVLHGPAFSALRLDMAEGESVLAQPGAMLAMTPGFAIDVRAGMHMEGRRGFARGIRSLFGGEIPKGILFFWRGGKPELQSFASSCSCRGSARSPYP